MNQRLYFSDIRNNGSSYSNIFGAEVVFLCVFYGSVWLSHGTEDRLRLFPFCLQATFYTLINFRTENMFSYMILFNSPALPVNAYLSAMF